MSPDPTADRFPSVMARVEADIRLGGPPVGPGGDPEEHDPFYDLPFYDGPPCGDDVPDLFARVAGEPIPLDADAATDESDALARYFDAFDSREWTTKWAELTLDGVELPPAETLGDAELTAKLWKLIHALAARRTYLYRTDHLNDRELYAHLVEESLHEPGPILHPSWGGNCTLDILGGCSEEDMYLSRKYYDSEEERRHWAESWPEDEMPPHEDPPFDRDRHLPRAEYD